VCRRDREGTCLRRRLGSTLPPLSQAAPRTKVSVSVPNAWRSWIPIAVVTVSGFCSLIYQVVWERMLRYNLGGDSVTAAIVTGTFLLGLGVGAFVFGRWHRAPFRWYAAVEAAIGIYGLASFRVLTELAAALGQIFPSRIDAAEGLRPVVVAASVLFLLPPCILIGGTTPLMFNCFIRCAGYHASRVGLIYGMNTAGAALGVLTAAFFLLNRFSLPTALALIGTSNVLLALLIWRLGAAPQASEAAEPTEPLSPASPTISAAGPIGTLPILGFAALSGLLSLAFEVTLVRALFVLNPSSPYNFPAVLIPFLLAIAVGSTRFTRLRGADPPRLLGRIGLLFMAAAVTSIAAVAVSGGLSLRGVRPEEFPGAVLLHVTLLAASLPLWLGAVLPLLLRLAAASGRALPARTGPVYLANALGSFAGALLTQFVGFPMLGTRGVLAVLFELGLLAGGVCLWQSGRLGSRHWAPALSLLTLGVLGPWAVPPVVWRAYAWGVTAADADVVEGVTGVARIDWDSTGGEVFVNGQSMSRLPDHPRHVRLVSFALALPRRDRVLLLGLGGGGMVRELVHDSGVTRIEVVDWSHELPRLLDGLRVRRVLDDTLHDPKVTLRRCDARVAVGLYEAATFDVVIDNLTIAHWVGATSVKSVEYFRQIRRILAPGGVFVYNGNYGGARRPILAGLTETFGDVQLHPGSGPVEEVVLASDHPFELNDGHVATILRRLPASGMHSPQDMIGGLMPLRRSELGRTRPVRDDVLRYEYHRDPLREATRAIRTFARSLARHATQ
jgi:spermidine synthase